MVGFVLLAFLALQAPPLSGQPAVFRDEVVVTASGEKEDLAEVNGAVTVIDREEIAALGAAAIGELLRTVPGATLLRSGLDNNVTSLFLRGAGSTQSLVLVDGVRLTSPFFGGYDWSLPLALDLDRVEVVGGPYSALYGGDAIGGVVQLVTRTADPTPPRAVLEGGSDGWRRVEVGGSWRVGRFSLTTAAGHRQGEGPLVNDDFVSRQGLVDLSTELGGGGRVGVMVRRAEGRAEVPFVGAAASPNRSTEQSETVAALPLRVALGSTVLEATISHVERSLSFRDPDDPWGMVASDTEADSDGVSLTLHRTLGGHRLSLGGEWRRDLVDDGSSFGPNLVDRSATTRSLYLQDAAELGRGWSLLAGLRWDAAAPWGGEISPRATVGWAGRALRAWLSYGEAFRAPSLGELYYPFAGNDDLAPERSRSRELGLRAAVGAGADLQVVAFSNRIDDLIDYDFAAQRYANVSQAAHDGVEVAATLSLGGGRARLSAAWLDARDGAGVALLRRPEWSSSLLWYGPLGGPVDGALELVWVGVRPDIDPVTFARVAEAGFVTANATLTVALSTGVRGRVRVTNLADREYEEVRGYPAPGRRLLVGLDLVLK